MVAYFFLSLMCGAASYRLAGWGIAQARRWWPSGSAPAQLALGSSVFTVLVTAFFGFCLLYAQIKYPLARQVDLLPALAHMTGGLAGVLKYLGMTWWGGAVRARMTYRAMQTGGEEPSKTSGWLVYVIGFGGAGLFVMAESLMEGHDYPLLAWILVLGGAVGLGGCSFLLAIGGDTLRVRGRALLLMTGSIFVGLAASWLAHARGAARPLVPLDFALAFAAGTACFYIDLAARVTRARAVASLRR